MLQHVFFSEIMSECCTNSALIPCHTFEIFAFKSDHINHLTDLSKLTNLNMTFQLPHTALMVGKKQMLEESLKQDSCQFNVLADGEKEGFLS